MKPKYVINFNLENLSAREKSKFMSLYSKIKITVTPLKKKTKRLDIL